MIKYLIPADMQPHTQRSIDLALKVFKLAQQEVTLLNVIQPPQGEELLADTTGKLEETYYEEAGTAATRLLDEISQPLIKEGANVNIAVIPGFIAATIKTIQAAESIPITILSPAQHAPAELLLESSMTQQLLRFDFSGTLVRAREIKADAKELWAIFLVRGDEDMHSIDKIVPALKDNIKILVVTPDPEATLILPIPGSKAALAVASQNPPEVVLKTAAQKFSALGRQHEQMLLQTRFKDWLTAYMRNSEVALVVVPREKGAHTSRSAYGTPNEEIFFKAPCPTALCNSD